MTKRELLIEYFSLCKELHLTIDGIYQNCNKSQIENAIECLKCSDEQLDDYFTVIKLKYPNVHRTISNNGNYKKHSFNRLYVFNTARFTLQ